MQGELIIGTDLNTDKFDRKIEKLEQRYKKQEVALKIKSDSIDDANRKLDEYSNKLRQVSKEQIEVSSQLKAKQTQYGFIDEKIKSGQAVTPQEYDAYGKLSNDIADLTAKQQQLNKEQEKYNALTDKAYNNVVKLKSQQDLIKDSMKQTNVEIQRTRFDQQQAQLKDMNKSIGKINSNINDVNKSINKIGGGLGKVVKSVVKWGLAIFGIRSVYLAIRQAMSTLSQYDDQMTTNVEYIRYLLASALKPIIETIIELAYKLLAYLNYIAKAWFGIDLFANASVKAFNKANGAAKKLQRTLAGFDEMNILNDNGTTGIAGGLKIPSFNIDDIEIPSWVKWIAEHKDLILTVLGALATTFAAATVGKWIKNLSGLTTALGYGSSGILGLLGKIALIGAGIVITITIGKKIWEEAAQLKKEIKQIRNAGAKGQEEWIKNEERINTLIDTGNVNRQAGYDLLKKTGGIWNLINGLGYENLETAKQTAINIQKQIDKEVELYKQGKLNKEEQELVKQNIIEQVKYNSELIQKLKENGFETLSIEKLNEGLIQNYKDMGGSVEEVETELGNINKIKFDDKEIEVKVYASTTAFKEAMRRAVEYGEKLLGGLGFSAGGGGNIGGSGGGFRAKGGVFYPSKLPKLAVGGIINYPGAGVPYNGAIIGERGAEAVVPLTDSQQMELLGSTIGRYVVIQLTNITELDGRQIARKVTEINQNDNFLLNR